MHTFKIIIKKNILLLIFASFIICTVSAQTNTVNYGNNRQTGHYAKINGIKLYYEIYGNGEPLLMLHGNGGSIEAFRNQIPYFEKHYKVIAVDSRIHGKSGGSIDTLSYDMMANDFAGLLDELHIDSAYVLGWSDGGINGLILAMKFPKKVKKLAVLGANTLADTTALYLSDIEGMKKTVRNPNTPTINRTLNLMMIEQPNIPYSELNKIHCNVLVMSGDKDVIKPEHSLKIFKSLPSASLCIFPNSYHDALIQHPALFNEIVIFFFNK